MKADLVATALAAIEALIVDELASKGPRKYVAIAKLCGEADRIRQMAITRVCGVLEEDDEGEAEQGDYIGAIGYDRPIPRLALPPNPLNQMADLARTVSDAMHRPPPVPTTTDQLDTIVRVRQAMVGMDITAPDRLEPLDNRITSLLSTLSKETDRAAHDSDVVHSELLRGHPAPGDVGNDVRPDPDRDHPGGAGRAALAGGPRAEGGVDRSGGDGVDVAEDGAEGTDRRGGEVPGQGAEAGPDHHLGGEVQERRDGGNPLDRQPRFGTIEAVEGPGYYVNRRPLREGA